MKIKNIIVVFLLLVLISQISQNASAKAATTDPGTLDVTGTGQSKAKPDVASLNIGTSSKGKTASEATNINAAAAQKLVDALIRSGIAEKDIQTTSINVSPIYKPFQPGQSDDANKIIGYQANNEVQATIRKISDVGKIVDTVTFTGDYSINGLNFTLENKDAFEADALQKAVADARKKADVVAASAKKSITGIKNISIGGASSPIKFASGFASAAGDISTPVLPGELTVTETVSIEYLLD